VSETKRRGLKTTALWELRAPAVAMSRHHCTQQSRYHLTKTRQQWTSRPAIQPRHNFRQPTRSLHLPIFLPCSSALLQRCVIIDPLAQGLMRGPVLENNVLAIIVVERVELGEGPSLLLLWRRPNRWGVDVARRALATRRTRAALAAQNRVSKQFLDEREESRNAGADQDKVCFNASKLSAYHIKLMRRKRLTWSKGQRHPTRRYSL
jgi:hypothetical protein